ncbi:MAG: hypothetical protein AW07_04606 [Candidatus Accumulibacter sp. SK-11]|nr:MAG: hypothetical protein AW07_04606 [Candidatus Accumulibacter sp. SK-11]
MEQRFVQRGSQRPIVHVWVGVLGLEVGLDGRCDFFRDLPGQFVNRLAERGRCHKGVLGQGGA